MALHVGLQLWCAEHGFGLWRHVSQDFACQVMLLDMHMAFLHGIANATWLPTIGASWLVRACENNPCGGFNSHTQPWTTTTAY